MPFMVLIRLDLAKEGISELEDVYIETWENEKKWNRIPKNCGITTKGEKKQKQYLKQ